MFRRVQPDQDRGYLGRRRSGKPYRKRVHDNPEKDGEEIHEVCPVFMNKD